jgi:hypothetical protein
MRFGLSDGDRVDLVSEFTGAAGVVEQCRVADFLVVPYPAPIGNAAAYYPETNSAVSLDHVAAEIEYTVSNAITICLHVASSTM